ncbi:hypothetical protein [Mycobacterium riyadhense]|uniref:hypothetical protein n=1 Tax=Mycobacterium riyadhense TaxID=486698 RepID=UPI001956FEB5|nr:hypothetical protein [Mycobacterium riyadhense]
MTYTFRADLTVLTGQTGVGKTTLLELIRFGLGGDGILASVARQYVSDVHVSVDIGDLRLQLSRGLDADRRRTVRVVDLVTRERLPEHSIAGDDPTISDLLLGAMGLQTGLKAAARGGRSTSAGAQITFNDIFRFMYVPQSEMNRDIAWSQQGYYDPKRKAVFELLFRLTLPSMLEMRSEINTMKSEIDIANRDAEVVRQFLADTGLTSRLDAEAKLTQAKRDEVTAKAVLNSLQGELADAVDRQSQVLRDLLNDAERSLAEAHGLSVEFERQRDEYEAERKRVALEIDRLARMESAGLRLANIEFSVCPRCTQRLDQRDIPAGTCRVCLQDDIVADLPARDQYETEQLNSQLDEIADQLRIINLQNAEAAEVIANRSELVRSLTADIDKRTATRVTPRLQAYADAAAKAERAQADQQSLDRILQQWDRAEDLARHAEDLASRRARLQSSLREMEKDLSNRKSEIFNELDMEFQTTVTDFGIPSIESASISPESYLPLLNGQPFIDVPPGGGIITATQVAYWISLVTVAARRRDTDFPAFLMLDSPRLALNAEEDIAGQMYRRFATQVGVTPGRLQFIVVDNKLPAGIDRSFNALTFSYNAPTVASVKHPGPAHVKTIDGNQDANQDAQS